MKKLYFKYGAMGSSKSANALMTAFNFEQKNCKVFLMKPEIDNREGTKEKPVIASRIGLQRECTAFSKDQDLYELVRLNCPDAQVVIVDEVQFCTKEQIEQLKELTENEVIVMCYGLLTNFKSELFEGSKRLIELAESIQEIKSVCRCGQKANLNARIVNGYVTTSGAEIQIGGDESYEAMCHSCYKKYQKEKLPSASNINNDLEEQEL